MAARFWILGTGTWDAADTTHWSATSGGSGGASVPGSGDTVTFNGSSGGGTVTVGAAYNPTITSITMGAFTGTLDFSANNNSPTMSTFSGTGTGTRTLNMGSGTWTITGTGTHWNITTTTNLTFSGGSATMAFTGTSGTFAGGGLSYGTVNRTGLTGGMAISGANTFANLSVVGSTNTAAAVTVSANQIVSGTLTLTGNSAQPNRLGFSSNTAGTARTITAATTTLTNVDFSDITAAGAGSWSGTSIGDALGNTGITFTTPVTRYWVGGTGSWGTAAEWSATSGGAGGASAPICHDNAVFDANSFTAGSQTVTGNCLRLCKDMTFTGVTNSPTVSITSSYRMYGSLTLAPSMTFSGSAINLLGRSSHTLTFSTATITIGSINATGFGGTFTQQDDLITTGDFTLGNGTYDSNDFDITCSDIFGGSTGTWYMGSGTVTLTGDSGGVSFDVSTMTIFSEQSTIKFTNSNNNPAILSAGFGTTYNNVWFSRGASTGNIEVYGSNTFNDFKDDGSAAHTIIFQDDDIQSVTTFTVSGSSGNVISLTSLTPGSAWTLSKSSGVVSCDYLSISDSRALGGATFYAGANSTSVSNNTGWHFNIPDVGHNFYPFLSQ